MTARVATVSVENFKQLVSLITWYQSMPSDVTVPDSFHESIDEKVNELLPDFPEVDSDDYYIGSYSCSVAEEVYVSLGSNDFRTTDKAIVIQIIPKLIGVDLLPSL